MKCLDEIEYDAKNRQQIAKLCMKCGTIEITGKFTTPINYDEQYAISHGYCGKCADVVYSELEAELKK
jgi:hypothetical protein